ncbi:MAG TPA: sulfotransferase family 2 domain-containing protein [Rhizomicrobium sp.]
MYEFDTFAFLDVQKTGSTFIISVLKKFCTEKTIRKEKHAGFESDFDPDKFYFISVRNPIDQYLSLYSYGCSSKGKLFLRMQKNDLSHFYDKTWNGFSAWLDFMLDSENAPLLKGVYGGGNLGGIARLVGLQSYRVLALAVPDTQTAFAGAATSSDVWTTFQSKNIANYTVKNETLRADLSELLRTRLKNSMSDLDAALDFIASADSRNMSERVDRSEDFPPLDARQLRMVEEREWLLYRAFGY